MSITEIAKMANVSKMTVSNVINKRYSKVSKATREKVERIIQETNYTPNLFARNLKSSSSKIILLAIPQTIDNDPNKDTAFDNPFYGELINSVETNLRKAGYYLMFRFVNDDEILSNLVVNWNIDGVIILGAIKKEIRTIFRDIDVPVVFIDTYADIDDSDTIITEDLLGAQMATQYLIQSGHQKIGIVTSSTKEVGVASKRFDGYRKALKDANIPFHKERVLESFPSYESGILVGHELAQRESEFDAVFVYSDLMAIGVIKGLKDKGIRIPRDIAVIGFDGLYIGELCEPKLTTIKQNVTDKGKMAVDLMTRKLSGESTKIERLVLPVTFVKKESA